MVENSLWKSYFCLYLSTVLCIGGISAATLLHTEFTNGDYPSVNPAFLCIGAGRATTGAGLVVCGFVNLCFVDHYFRISG